MDQLYTYHVKLYASGEVEVGELLRKESYASQNIYEFEKDKLSTKCDEGENTDDNENNNCCDCNFDEIFAFDRCKSRMIEMQTLEYRQKALKKHRQIIKEIEKH